MPAGASPCAAQGEKAKRDKERATEEVVFHHTPDPQEWKRWGQSTLTLVVMAASPR